jgi:hypothetical protein
MDKGFQAIEAVSSGVRSSLVSSTRMTRKSRSPPSLMVPVDAAVRENAGDDDRRPAQVAQEVVFELCLKFPCEGG